MKRATYSTLASLVVALSLAGACGGESLTVPDDQGEGVVEGDDKSDVASAILGTWTSASSTLGELRSLELRADKTFTALVDRACLSPGCDEENGSYKLTRSTNGPTRYVRLTSNGRLLGRYAYTLSGNTLSLRETTTQATFTLTRGALADEGEDCKSFGNPTLPDCAPGLACQPGPLPDTAHCVVP